MFTDWLNETVTVRTPTGTVTDGQPEYREYPARAFVFDYSEQLLKEIGMVKNAKFFVLAATAETAAAFAAPMVGAIIIHNGGSYDLKRVRPCRDLDGRIACYSCVGV